MPERALALEIRLAAAAAFIRERVCVSPSVGLILGSGLGDFADTLPDPREVRTSEIPYYPAATVEGHRGRLVFSASRGALAFQGRAHFYESNDAGAVLFPIWIAQSLGVRTLIVTNAAGGVNRQFTPGDLMVISDQINLTYESAVGSLPGRGPAGRPLYDPGLASLAMEIARLEGIPVRRGVYAGVKGPSYETAAEVEMVHRAGGDAVGMSTVLEVGLASALGMRVLGISCITNKATGFGAERLNHAEVTEVAARVRQRFTLLLNLTLDALSRAAEVL